MDALPLQCVCVSFDGDTSQHDIFPDALDWADRLGLPLCGHSLAAGRADWFSSCAAACRKRGVVWETRDDSATTNALHVISGVLPDKRKRELVHRSLLLPGAAVLVCPPRRQPAAKVLLLNQERDHDNPFLDLAIGYCQAAGLAPVVLTVAATEAEAERRQALAEKKFATRLFAADFATVVGEDLPSAVRGMARWCHCSYVLVGRTRPGLWWRWLRGETVERLLNLSTEFGILSLPDTCVAGVQKRERIEMR